MSNKTIIQNDADWLKWRCDGIGGSDVPIIMGLSSYSTRKKLLMEKAKRLWKEQEYNYILELGHRAEEHQRKLLTVNSGVLFEDKVVDNPVIESKVYPWLRASLDGYVPRLLNNVVGTPYIWEHKLVGRKKYEKIQDGICPDDFFVQIQHQLFVSATRRCLLQATLLDKGQRVNYKETAYLMIEKDIKQCKKQFDILKSFWNEVLALREQLGIK